MQRTIGGQRGCDGSRFAPARLGARTRDDCELVEHNRGVLDEDRVGHLLVGIQPRTDHEGIRIANPLHQIVDQLIQQGGGHIANMRRLNRLQPF